MPSRNQGASRTGERERFPDIADAIGYDPARYLDVPLVEPGGLGTPKIHMAISMIQGISRLGVANGWIEAERRLERAGDPDDPEAPDPGPRPQIMGLLEAKVDQLVEHGQRPPTLPADAPARYREHNRERPPSDVYLVRREVDQEGELEVVERSPIEDVRERSGSAKLAKKRTG